MAGCIECMDSNLEKSTKEIIDEIFDLVPGMITKEDASFLYETASKCSKAMIVEVGSYHGLSTICLAKGSKSGGKVQVYSVDPYSGLSTTPDPTWRDSEHPGTPNPKYYNNVGAIFFEVRERFKELQVSNIITSIVNYSEPAYKQGWDMPIELLFLDGEHRYNYVKMDLEMWGKHVISGGMIIMHDQTYPGVKRVIDEMIIDNPKYVVEWEPLFHAIVKY